MDKGKQIASSSGDSEESTSLVFRLVNESETRDHYSSDQIVEWGKISKLEEKGKLDIKNGEGIKEKSKMDIIQNTFSFGSRKNILYVGRFMFETPIEIKSTEGQTALSIVNRSQIADRLEKVKLDQRELISYVHLGTLQILVRSTFLKGIDSPIQLVIIDRRIKHPYDRIIGAIEGNLKYSVVKFNVSLQFGIPLVTENLDNCIGIMFKFVRKNLMNEGNYPFSITYAIGYALSNSHHSVEFAKQSRIQIDDLFKRTNTKLLVLNPQQDSNPRLIKVEEEEPTSKLLNSPTRDTKKDNFTLVPPRPSIGTEVRDLQREIRKLTHSITGK